VWSLSWGQTRWSSASSNEKGIKDDVELRAQKEILAEQIREAMERKGVSFSALASSMGTSRTVVYRLLDPSDTGGDARDALARCSRARARAQGFAGPRELTGSPPSCPARHRGFEPLTYGSGGTRKYPESRGKSADRDGLVTAIAGALSSAAAREPQALSRCVEALGLVLGALIESAGEDVTGADDERGCGDALPSRA
jgi:hypothetical protein